MQNINKEKIVPYSAVNMYSLVADIEKYPDFVPYCTNSEILISSDDIVEACIEVSYLGMSQILTTKNIITPNVKITMTLIKGPVESLTGSWSFIDVNSTSSKVLLELELDIGNKALGMLSVGLLDKAASQIMSAFSTRAEQLYG